MDNWNGLKPFQVSPNPKGVAFRLTLVSLTRVMGMGRIDEFLSPFGPANTYLSERIVCSIM